MKGNFKAVFVTALAAMTVPISGIAANPDIDEIVASSPEAKSLSSKLDAEVGNTKYINNLPDPQVDFSHQWGMYGVGNKWGAGVSQSFDWPAAYPARKRLAQSMRDEALATYTEAMAQLRLRVKLLLIDLAYANRDIAIIDSINNSLASLCDKYKLSYKNGDATLLDIKKIEIEQLRMSHELTEAIDNRAVIIGQLQGINPEYDWATGIETVDFPPLAEIYQLSQYEEWAKSADPQRQSLLSKQAVSMDKATVEKKLQLPSLSVGYRYDYEQGDKFNGLSVGFSLPFFAGRNKAKASELEALAYESMVDAREADVTAQMATLRNQAIRERGEYARYKEILGASDSERLLKMALNGGEISLLNYLQETSYFYQAQRDFLSTEHELHSTMARLNRYVPGQ